MRSLLEITGNGTPSPFVNEPLYKPQEAENILYIGWNPQTFGSPDGAIETQALTDFVINLVMSKVWIMHKSDVSEYKFDLNIGIATPTGYGYDAWWYRPQPNGGKELNIRVVILGRAMGRATPQPASITLTSDIARKAQENSKAMSFQYSMTKLLEYCDPYDVQLLRLTMPSWTSGIQLIRDQDWNVDENHSWGTPNSYIVNEYGTMSEHVNLVFPK